MLKHYMIFNSMTGQYDKYDTLEEAVSAKYALLEAKYAEARQSTVIQAEGVNSKGESILVLVSDEGVLTLPTYYIPSLTEIEEGYGRPLTEDETAAWQEYIDLLHGIEDQPGFPWDISMPLAPGEAPR